MRFPAAKLLATITCSLSLLGVAAAPSEACCFLSSLFGCCSPRYGACYAPSGCGSSCGPSGCATTYYSPGCSTGSCGSTAYYSSSWGSSSCNSCSPCSTGCSPCGTGCASGDCAVSSASPSPSSVAPPVADPSWRKKKTYAEPENGSGSGTGTSSPDNSGSGSSAPGGGTRVKPEGFREDDESTTGFKPPMSSGDIQQAGGEQEGESVPVRRKEKKSPEAPSIPADDEAGNGAGHLPTLNLDEKIAWRSAPERKRVALKVRTANARLVRVPAYPKSDWTPVEPESKVAKK